MTLNPILVEIGLSAIDAFLIFILAKMDVDHHKVSLIVIAVLILTALYFFIGLLVNNPGEAAIFIAIALAEVFIISTILKAQPADSAVAVIAINLPLASLLALGFYMITLRRSMKEIPFYYRYFFCFLLASAIYIGLSLI